MMPETNLIAGFWTPAHFAELTGGTWLIPPRDAGAAISGISIDSRGLAAGQGFVAIRGERFDGHRFLAEAAAKGAALAIVEQPQPGADAPMAVLQVASTLAALQRLASHWRDRLGEAGCRIISVSGSNGKTTTRHLVHQVLTTAGLVGSQSPKSFNNRLGVPLTLLAAQANQHFVVAEIGTNHPGEIAALASILRPDIALITSIGEEHLEFFHDLEGVAQEESQVFAQIAEGGVAIIPAREHHPARRDSACSGSTSPPWRASCASRDIARCSTSTSIGEEHLEYFHDLRRRAREESRSRADSEAAGSRSSAARAHPCAASDAA